MDAVAYLCTLRTAVLFNLRLIVDGIVIIHDVAKLPYAQVFLLNATFNEKV